MCLNKTIMAHNCNCEKNSLCFARYHLETTITVISFSVLQIALLHPRNSSVHATCIKESLFPSRSLWRGGECPSSPQLASPGHRSQGGDSALEATCCVGAATFRVTSSDEGRGTEQHWMDPQDQQLRARSRAAPEGKSLCLQKIQPLPARHGAADGLFH